MVPATTIKHIEKTSRGENDWRSKIYWCFCDGAGNPCFSNASTDLRYNAGSYTMHWSLCLARFYDWPCEFLALKMLGQKKPPASHTPYFPWWFFKEGSLLQLKSERRSEMCRRQPKMEELWEQPTDFYRWHVSGHFPGTCTPLPCTWAPELKILWVSKCFILTNSTSCVTVELNNYGNKAQFYQIKLFSFCNDFLPRVFFSSRSWKSSCLQNIL